MSPIEDLNKSGRNQFVGQVHEPSLPCATGLVPFCIQHMEHCLDSGVSEFANILRDSSIVFSAALLILLFRLSFILLILLADVFTSSGSNCQTVEPKRFGICIKISIINSQFYYMV